MGESPALSEQDIQTIALQRMIAESRVLLQQATIGIEHLAT